MIDAKGHASCTLFNLGPGRLGTLLESIAVPEIRQQAVNLAAVLTDILVQSEFGKPVLVSRMPAAEISGSKLALVNAS